MFALAPRARLISMSAGGRFVAIRQVAGIDIVDALGTAPRAGLSIPEVVDFSCVGGSLWVAVSGALRRYALEGAGERARQPIDLGAGALVAARGEEATTALWWGESRSLLRELGGEVAASPVAAGAGATAAPLAGSHLVVADGATVSVRDGDRELSSAALPGGRAVAAAPLFSNRALAVVTRADTTDSVVVLRAGGGLIHHLAVPRVERWAVADERGLAVLVTDRGGLVAVDLRYGKPLGEADAPIPVEDLAIDAAGVHAALAGFRDDDDQLAVLHVGYTDLFGRGAPRRTAGNGRVPPGGDDAPPDVREQPGRPPAGGDAREPAHESEPAQRARGPEPAADPAPAPAPAAERPPRPPPPLPPRALHPARAPAPRPDEDSGEAPPYDSALDHLDDLLALAAARAARAIADGWDSGRLSVPSDEAHPFEHEVLALVGSRLGAARAQREAADRRAAAAAERAAARAAATRATGAVLPFDEIADEFGLSAAAAEVLLVAAAPALRGEIARLYGILANDEARPVCDPHLVELVLRGTAGLTAHDVARELGPDAPLARSGLLRVQPSQHGQPLFAAITVDPVLLARLRGAPLSGLGPGSATRIRHADRDLDELTVPPELVRELLLAASRPPDPERPLRLVVKGRPGSGRHALLAALAARAGRPLAIVDCEQIPTGDRRLPEALRAELRRATLRGAIPCVDGLEATAASDEDGVDAVREVFRSHPGPALVRAPPEFKPPLDPGHVALSIPPLSEGQRLQFWQGALARRGLTADRVSELAARFRIGPGTIETVISLASDRLAASPDPSGDASEALDEAARQHIDQRLGAVATRVARLARWEQVALPDDVLDSIREFVGRVRHRRTVYESWGFDAKMSTSRGLSALFYGPPGTGKSMVAGLIARELALDLYRVDLARITSKWIGETEKNLAQVFDAAEDGQSVILFDEADSLFAKRTEVKSSVDRYANLEVNYLLQRLDTFEGIAILTTNQEGSLDNAFKRRLSLRLAFPFPDEDMRVKLWAAHIPAEVPTAGEFDFGDLARRFPMSGGYIRNSALRAAFLAAQEDVPMSQDHLVRAIHLEYREMGKLAPGGKME